jgi:hypothetical protein
MWLKPIHNACKNSDIDTVKKILNNPHRRIDDINDGNIDDCGQTPFIYACRNGNMELVNMIMHANGFNSLNKTNFYGGTAFSEACWHGHVEVIKTIIKATEFDGLNKKDFYNNYPIEQACCMARLNTVRELLKQPNIIIPKYLSTPNSETGKEIKELIRLCRIDLFTMRERIIMEENLDTYFHIVFLSDGYYELKQNEPIDLNNSRFMIIASQLPMELQMILIYRLSGSTKSNIPGHFIEDYLKDYVRRFYLSYDN